MLHSLSFEEVLQILFIERLESETRSSNLSISWRIVGWQRLRYSSHRRLDWWPTKFRAGWNGLDLVIDIEEPCRLEVRRDGSGVTNVITGESTGPQELQGPLLVAFLELNRAIYENVIWNKRLRGTMGGITFLRDCRRYGLMEALKRGEIRRAQWREQGRRKLARRRTQTAIHR